MAIGFSQGGFAKAVGMTPSLLSSYEHARSQLNYRAAWQVFLAFPELSPEWLAKGDPYPMLIVPAVDYPSPESCPYGERASFNEVFEDLLTHRIRAARAAFGVGKSQAWPYFKFESGASGRLFAVTSWALVMRNWLAYVPDSSLNEFLNGLLHFGEAALGKLPEQNPEIIEGRRKLLNRLAVQWFGSRSFRSASPTEVSNAEQKIKTDKLDMPSPAVMLRPMSSSVPTWSQLRKLIAQQTQARGAKAALAKKLGVSRQVLTNWLADREQGAPNAELTLELLEMFWKPAAK